MFIKKLQFKNFKRFSDLVIDLDPKNSGESPKLVLLIGANGSGKSCIFDGFKVLEYEIKLSELKKNSEVKFKQMDYEYMLKNPKFDIGLKIIRSDGKILKYETDPQNRGLDHIQGEPETFSFYGRNSSKIVPEITPNPGIDFVDQVTQNLDNPIKTIFRDERFLSDVPTYSYLRQEALNQATLNKTTQTVDDINEQFYAPLNRSLQNIFGHGGSEISLIFKAILPATTFGGSPNLLFQKGNSEILYDYLSHGEKQAVVTILDIMVRPQFYTDSIVYFDELDLHLHTSLQVNLLEEIVRLVPDSSQVWVSSHALGFIQFTQEYEKGAIIDFDSLNFDEEQELSPLPKNSLNVFEVAVPKTTLETILKGKRVYFCEGKNDRYYNLLDIEDVVFIGGTRRNKDSILFDTRDTDYNGIIDRDYLTDGEIEILKNEYKNIRVLGLYSIENYWYHPENIFEVDPDFNIDEYKKLLLDVKNDCAFKLDISSSRKKYLFFKEKNETIERGAEEVANLLKSDEFEVYYPYFDVKKYLKKKPNFSTEKLSQTNWFKTQIENILKS